MAYGDPTDLIGFYIAFEFCDCTISTHPELIDIERVRVAHEKQQGPRTSFATDVMKRSSCEITITPPFHLPNASIRASRPSKSR